MKHRLRGNKGSKTITIPAEFCNRYDFKAGDWFEISIIEPNELRLKKIIQL
jgi:hypothetical protein